MFSQGAILFSEVGRFFPSGGDIIAVNFAPTAILF